jgi:acyl-CoA reductase-like NAD-dependent aldehyde dehydrogenase
MGPVISREHRDRILDHIERAIDEGAKLLTGGRRPLGPQFERGYWVEPTVFGDVDPSMSIARVEVFGPVLSVLTWSDPDELHEIVNSSDYGLTAAVWGTDLSKAIRVAEKIHTGYVWVNTIGAKPLGVPYGGVKNSGIGRESSVEELLSFVQTKSMNIHLGGR